MNDSLAPSLTLFSGMRRLATGTPAEVVPAAQAALARDPGAGILAFDDATGAVVDLDLRDGVLPAASAEEQPRGRGRPKLGVIAREVTLLPRHWDWLAAQPGGASQALRRLVDAARQADGGATRRKAAQAAAYRFMAALAGDLPGFEEAARALFADDRQRFDRQTADWPADVRAHAATLAWPEIP